jgi:hypothetical protein
VKILFDHNVDRRFRKHLPTHFVRTTREIGCDRLKNGELILAAFDSGFDVFLSIDKNIEREHNLLKVPIPIVILDSLSNALPYLVEFAPAVLSLCSTPLTPALYLVSPDGSVQRLTAPR